MCFSLFSRLLLLLGVSTKLLGHGDLLNQEYQSVHNEDSVGCSFGICAEVSDEYGEQTAAYAVDDLAALGNGRSSVVGSHKDSTQHQTAGEEAEQHGFQMAEVTLGEQEGDNSAATPAMKVK